MRRLALELNESAAPRRAVIPIVGYVGAGASIDPDFEQAPPEGFEQVEWPAPPGFVADPIGFRVRGDSMTPTYEENAIVVVAREQPFATDQMIGMACAVRARGQAGQGRYFKRIRAGSGRELFNLESINDRSPTIPDARIAWASPVRLVIPDIRPRRRRTKDRSRER